MKFLKYRFFKSDKEKEINQVMHDEAQKISADGLYRSDNVVSIVTVENDKRPAETWKEVALLGMEQELNAVIAKRVSLESDRRFYMSKHIENPANGSAENQLVKANSEIKIYEAKIKYLRQIIKELEDGAFEPLLPLPGVEKIGVVKK